MSIKSWKSQKRNDILNGKKPNEQAVYKAVIREKQNGSIAVRYLQSDQYSAV